MLHMHASHAHCGLSAGHNLQVTLNCRPILTITFLVTLPHAHSCQQCCQVLSRQVRPHLCRDKLETEQGVKPAFLVQGTLYPDVIESCPPPGSGQKHSHTIKSHHNVGGLPKDLQFELIEPLRELFKDEVRTMGQILGVPEVLTPSRVHSRATLCTSQDHFPATLCALHTPPSPYYIHHNSGQVSQIPAPSGMPSDTTHVCWLRKVPS
jgi:hypothetical protein